MSSNLNNEETALNSFLPFKSYWTDSWLSDGFWSFNSNSKMFWLWIFDKLKMTIDYKHSKCYIVRWTNCPKWITKSIQYQPSNSNAWDYFSSISSRKARRTLPPFCPVSGCLKIYWNCWSSSANHPRSFWFGWVCSLCFRWTPRSSGPRTRIFLSLILSPYSWIKMLVLSSSKLILMTTSLWPLMSLIR